MWAFQQFGLRPERKKKGKPWGKPFNWRRRVRITEPSATRSFTKEGTDLDCGCSNLCRTACDVCPWSQHLKRVIPPDARGAVSLMSPGRHTLQMPSPAASAGGFLLQATSTGTKWLPFISPTQPDHPSPIASAKHDYTRLLERPLKWRRDQLVCLLPRRDAISIALMLLLECIRPPSNNTTRLQKSACLRGDWSVWWRFLDCELSLGWHWCNEGLETEERKKNRKKSRGMDSSYY